MDPFQKGGVSPVCARRDGTGRDLMDGISIGIGIGIGRGMEAIYLSVGVNVPSFLVDFLSFFCSVS